MKKNPATYIMAAALGMGFLSTTSEAQIHNSGLPLPVNTYSNKNAKVYSAPQVAEMVKSLNGSNLTQRGVKSRNLVNRSVKISPQVAAKGHAYQGSSAAPRSHQYPAANPYYDGGSSAHGNRYGYQQQGHAPAQAQAGCEICYQVDQSARLCTNEIKFHRNSTTLADQCSYHYLENLAHALLDPSLVHQRFVIEGHASAEGSYSSNQFLSQRRANAIFDFLVNHGINPSRLLSVGHGEAHAQYSARSPEYLRAKDRRVVVYKLAH